MKQYMVRFVEFDTTYNEPGYIERTIVCAESREDAIKQVVDDMTGCKYEIVEVVEGM